MYLRLIAASVSSHFPFHVESRYPIAAAFSFPFHIESRYLVAAAICEGLYFGRLHTSPVSSLYLGLPTVCEMIMRIVREVVNLEAVAKDSGAVDSLR